jgi:hypothetical protein
MGSHIVNKYYKQYKYYEYYTVLLMNFHSVVVVVVRLYTANIDNQNYRESKRYRIED